MFSTYALKIMIFILLNAWGKNYFLIRHLKNLFGAQKNSFIKIAQKNNLIEMILLSTHNICFG